MRSLIAPIIVAPLRSRQPAGSGAGQSVGRPDHQLAAAQRQSGDWAAPAGSGWPRRATMATAQRRRPLRRSSRALPPAGPCRCRRIRRRPQRSGGQPDGQLRQWLADLTPDAIHTLDALGQRADQQGPGGLPVPHRGSHRYGRLAATTITRCPSAAPRPWWITSRRSTASTRAACRRSAWVRTVCWCRPRRRRRSRAIAVCR